MDEVKAAAERLLSEVDLQHRTHPDEEDDSLLSFEADVVTVAQAALSRDRAPGEVVTRALERIADEFHFQHIIRDDAWKTTAVPVPSRVQCPQKFCTLATVALAARPEGAPEPEQCSVTFDNERIQGRCPYQAAEGSDMCADHDARRIDR